MNRPTIVLAVAALFALPALAAPPAKAPAVKAAPEAIPAPSDVAAPPADAETTPSGLASRVIQAGTGTLRPELTDSVKVHYTGWTTDGKMFDSSAARNRPIVFPLNAVIAGWREGVQLMVEGEQRRLWIPAKLAYEGIADRPQGMLVFDVQLIDILRVPPTPPDVAAPPADAAKSSSGLASKILTPGTGTRKPRAQSIVRVHYTGWTVDGKLFDSSLTKGTPAVFKLTEVIPGWTEGLQLMSEGEVRRFWIPKGLAYRGAEGKPAGMLVFDVELVEITKP